MVAEKKQKSGEMDKENNGPVTIDGDLVLSIEKLQEIQDELEKINEEASEKVLEVEQKFNEIRKPVYDKRNDIVKSIPDFWFTAFMSHPGLAEHLTEEDQKIFKYLSNLQVEDCKDVKFGFSITFHFKPNPYFEDTKLTKTFTFGEEGTTKITSTPIKWKEGMGISNGVAEDKKGKRSHSEESFFTWFSDSEHKGEMYEIHDEVADTIKEDLWPNPITYFNNDDEEEEEGFEMDEDDDDENDSDGSEEDDGDDDDDEVED